MHLYWKFLLKIFPHYLFKFCLLANDLIISHLALGIRQAHLFKAFVEYLKMEFFHLTQV